MKNPLLPSLATAGALCAFAFASSSASAAILSYDGFNYDVGTNVSGQNGGIGWSDAWGDVNWSSTGGSHTIGAGSLSVPGHLSSTGNRAVIDASSGTIATPRSLPAGIDTGSGSLYFSYLTQKTIDTERSLNVSFAVGTSEQFAIGQLSNTDGTNHTAGNFGVYAHNNMTGTGTFVIHADTPIAYDMAAPTLVVGHINFGFDGDNDQVSIFLNPTPGAGEGTPYIQFSDYDLGSLSAFRMFAGGTSGTFSASAGEFDEFRFGDSYADVIPEPSTYAAIFGGLALGVALLRRRLRKQ